MRRVGSYLAVGGRGSAEVGGKVGEVWYTRRASGGWLVGFCVGGFGGARVVACGRRGLRVGLRPVGLGRLVVGRCGGLGCAKAALMAKNLLTVFLVSFRKLAGRRGRRT